MPAGDFSKEDSSKCSSHRAVVLDKYVRFILFSHILLIFPFLGKLKKSLVGSFVRCVMAFISNTKKPYCSVLLIEYQTTCCYRKIALLLKYDNVNINKATFH